MGIRTGLYMFSILFGVSAWAAPDLSGIQVNHAYISKDGQLIMELSDKDPESKLIGSNRTFAGSVDGGLHQMNLTTMSKGFSKEEGVKTWGASFEGGRFDVDRAQGRYALSCGKDETRYRPLSQKELRDLEKTIRKGVIKLNLLPNDREPSYLLRSKDTGEFIYVDLPRFTEEYDFNVYIGKAGKMKQVKVQDAERFRDGGTTEITLADGRMIYIPSAIKQDEVPTFDDQNLVALDPTKFDLESIGIKRPKVTKLTTPCSEEESAEGRNSHRRGPPPARANSVR